MEEMKVILDAKQLQHIIKTMKNNQAVREDLTLTACVSVEFSSRYNAYVIKPQVAEQFSAYAECFPGDLIVNE